MIKFIFKLGIFFIIILFAFAIIPDRFWQWLKPYFNWEVFLKTITTGWQKFWKFIQEATGINFYDLFDKIKNYLGLDILNIWQSIKIYFVNILEKTAKFLKLN